MPSHRTTTSYASLIKIRQQIQMTNHLLVGVQYVQYCTVRYLSVSVTITTLMKQKLPSRRSFAAAATTLSAKKVIENPFDRFANTRKKHEVLNRRVKGEDRNVGRAREKVAAAAAAVLIHLHDEEWCVSSAPS